MNRRIFLSAGLAGLAACSRTPSSLRKLRVAAPLGLSLSSLHLSLEAGFFEDAGFDVEILTITRSPEALAALAGNKVEVLFAPQNVAILNAVTRGLPVRVVAGREFISPNCRRMAFLCGLRRNFPKGLQDLSVLKGKKVAAGSSISFMHFALDEHLKTAGLTLDDVTVLNLSGPEAIAALLKGALDAYLLFDESLLPETAEELVFSRSFAEIRPNFQYGLILYGQALREAGTETGRRFLEAYFRGVREFQRGRTPRFLKEFARQYGVDPKRIESLCRSHYTPDGSVDLKSLKAFCDWAFSRAYIPRPVEPAELVDLRFTRKADA